MFSLNTETLGQVIA